jgi:hypothetical protein
MMTYIISVFAVIGAMTVAVLLASFLDRCIDVWGER